MAYGQYTEDKPKDCRYCYFWGRKKKGCMLDSCYYQRKPENVIPLKGIRSRYWTMKRWIRRLRASGHLELSRR